MAKYFTDFRENAIASGTPAGWTARYTTTGVTRAIAADSSGKNASGKHLRITHTATAMRGTSFNVLDTDPDRITFQIKALARLNKDLSAFSAYAGPARGSGAVGAENTIAAIFGENADGSQEFSLMNSVAGSRVYTAAPNGGSNSWLSTDFYWLTLTVSGTNATLSAAHVDTPETVIVTQSIANSVNEIGWIGFWHAASNADLIVLAVGVGTGADQAPSAPVAPTTAPTIGTITPSGTSASVPYTGVDLYATGVEYRIDGGAWVDGGATSPISVFGLTESTPYDIELRAYNAAGPGPVSTLATFTTTAGALVKGATITLYNGATPQANLTDLRVLWWDATAPDGTAPDYYSAAESTDAAGLLSVDINAVTALSVGDYGYLHVHKAGTLGNQYRDAVVFAGAVQVQDIG